MPLLHLEARQQKKEKQRKKKQEKMKEKKKEVSDVGSGVLE
jgi:hypothetical protein